MASFRADYRFCGTFSGKDIPANKWLMKLDWELEGYQIDGVVPAPRIIQAFNLLLVEDAETWAESHPRAKAILTSEPATRDSVANFRSLLCERFPAKSSEVATVSFNTELSELKQQDESLSAYYERVSAMMQRVGARDRPHSQTPGTQLTLLEEAMLDNIMRSFLKGLADPDVCREATRGLASVDSSLRGIYMLAEQARRTKEEFSRLEKEQFKSRENEMLRSIIEKTMSKDQLDSLVSSFQTNATARPSNSSWDSLSEALERLRIGNTAVTTYQPKQDHPYQPERYQHQNPPHNQRQAPSFQSDRPPLAIAQNPNRQPANGYQTNSYQGHSNDYQNNGPLKPSTNQSRRDLPDRKRSKNPFVNGSRIYSKANDGLLCVRCGTLGKRAGDGHDCGPLPAWEQSYLREVVFGTSPQSNFAAASFGANDGAAKPWEWPRNSESSSSSTTPLVLTPTSSSVTSPSVRSIFATPSAAAEAFSKAAFSDSAFSNSVGAEPFGKAHSYYGEGSAPGKRPADHLDLPQQGSSSKAPRQVPLQAPNLQQYTSNQPYVPAQPQSQSQLQPQPNPQVPNPAPHQAPNQQPFPAPQQFQPGMPFVPATTTGRPKKKGQKRVGKRTELQPLIGMYNDAQGKFDPAVSIRHVMQQNRLDMTLMDMLAWSPAMCKELKRLCTRVTNRRAQKLTNPAVIPDQPNQFNFVPQSIPNPGFQASQNPSNPSTQATVARVVAIPTPDHHTKKLRELAGSEKAYNIGGAARVNGKETHIPKKHTSADQGSDMNVMSTSMTQVLSLVPKSLAEVGFLGLCMETADHRETLLETWVLFDYCVEGLWRSVPCFVSPPTPGVEDVPRLLLGLPWLHDINAVISVRNSSIQIGDPAIGEQVRFITGPELVYHRDHSLLMYPKAFIPAEETFQRVTELEQDEDESESEESSSGDELSDVEDGEGF